MRVERIGINHYRSIENIELSFPSNKPLILFGPNNAGKSNIISAIDRVLGERYAPYITMLDSDFYMRDKDSHPVSTISCRFDDTFKIGKYGNTYNEYIVKYNVEASRNMYCDKRGNQLYVSNEDRHSIQSFLIDAERSINYQLSYSSKYTLLSKFSHSVHAALSNDDKAALNDSFAQIKQIFEGIPEYSSFTEDFIRTVTDSVRGFVHQLEVDFSAYDPNNYANAMKILAKENDDVRSFEEFGTGEQQVLLMAFAKAYMEAFGSESIVLIFEEPEAHLHPLAQKWLKEYIYELCESGLQIVVSTHSADFLDPDNLEGLVRVFKDSSGITRTRQLNSNELTNQCIESGAPESRINESTVGDFYAAKFTPDTLKGLFAQKVLLVEGQTEYHSLPVYLKKAGCSFPKDGIEIIDCMGKSSITSFARLFKAYGIETFCLFDGDRGTMNDDLQVFCDIPNIVDTGSEFYCDSDYGYFAKDYEDTLRSEIGYYIDLENNARNTYKLSGKPAVARYLAYQVTEIEIPRFVTQIAGSLCKAKQDDIVDDNDIDAFLNDDDYDDLPF